MDALLVIFVWWSVVVGVLSHGMQELNVLARGSIILCLTLNSLFFVEVPEASWVYAAAHGVVFALSIRLIGEIYIQAAQAVDMFRGAQFSEQYTPGVERQMSVLERLVVPILLCVAFESGAIYSMFEIRELSVTSLQELAYAAYESIRIALSAALKIGLVLLGVDLSLALAGRHIPGINIAFESLPYRQLFGLFLLGVYYEAI